MGLKYTVNEKFFDSWNRNMAYVLGYLYADGSLENAHYLRGKYIRVTSIDRKSIDNIRESLKSEHRIITLEPKVGSREHIRYFLRIGSHKLYDSLIKLGLYPNKSLTVKFPTIIPKKFLADFLRGYLDGDGCVYLYTSKGIKQENIIRKLAVIFTSGSFDFLTGLCNTLKTELDLDNGKVYNSHRSFQLRYSTRDSLKVFKFLYKDRRDALYLQRKFEVFCTYFRRRSSKIDIETALILSNDGAVAKW